MKSWLALLFAFPCVAAAQTYRWMNTSFRVVKIVEGLEQPWSLAFLPDGRMLVTEKAGRLRIVSQGKLDPEAGGGSARGHSEVQAACTGVLMLHPQFEKNRFGLSFAYAARGGDGAGTELARGRLAGHRLEGVEVLFKQTPKGRAGQHFGGRIVFNRAGILYLTLGDRGERERAQRPDDHAGSVIRLHDDGRVPKDNPFNGKSGWKPEKFTVGHRNVQAAALHPPPGAVDRTSTARRAATS